ncbi:hypothetical protein [Clostridium sartagoforme]|uniref:hypothetical protein n=1 Tax=Clostridium sartagoforme TaxID=84031 RepID=UPI000399B94F|nr:hypothetical protein [Clostridium sartagoforme]
MLLFTYPGSPCIYYGSEVGMSGGEHKNRQPMIWDEAKQNKELFLFIKKLIQLRKTYESFRIENFQWMNIEEGNNIIMYKKECEKEVLYVVLNNDSISKKIAFPEEIKGLKVKECIEEKDILIDKEIELLPYNYKVYLQNK